MKQDKAYILILDDDPTNLYVLEKMLKSENNIVSISATTGEEALQLLEEREYALAILDIHLPGMNGLDLIRHMRKSDVLRKIPIIFVTAVYKDSESIAEGYALGAADYIFKPVDINILRSKVKLFANLYFYRKGLERSEASLRESQHLAKVGSWEFDLQTREIWASDEGFHIYGMVPPSSNLLLIDEIEACIPEKERVHQTLVDLINEDKPYDLEFDILPANGSARKRIISRAKLERDNKGNPIRVTGVVQDISEQRAQMEQKERARKNYHQLYGSIRDAILIADTDRCIIDINPAFSDLFGYSLGDLKGQKTSVICQNESEFRRFGELIRQNENSGKTIIHNIMYRKKSGEIFPGETALFPIHDAKGIVTGLMGLTRDITEKKDLEQQLVYAQKLEGIGLLAAGVAHEINTPIMYVAENANFLKNSFARIVQQLEKLKELFASIKNNQDLTSLLPDIEKAIETLEHDFLLEEIPEAIADTLKGTARISHIVQALKKFSHPGMDTLTLMDVNDAVENNITIASNEWRYDSRILRDFEKDLPMIECVPGDFNQTILNILVNAAHANTEMAKTSGGKGDITISTVLDGEFVKISISDTGMGIPIENHHKIFNPFFTTKEVGKGTGQGLPITHNILKKHNGTITFTSEENKGTTFILRFPIKQNT